MCKPKFKIIERPKFEDWAVCFASGKVIEVFNHKENAERYAQQLVENDVWHAANR